LRGKWVEVNLICTVLTGWQPANVLPPGQCGYSEIPQTAMIFVMAWCMVVWFLQICMSSDFISSAVLGSPPA